MQIKMAAKGRFSSCRQSTWAKLLIADCAHALLRRRPHSSVGCRPLLSVGALRTYARFHMSRQPKRCLDKSMPMVLSSAAARIVCLKPQRNDFTREPFIPTFASLCCYVTWRNARNFWSGSHVLSGLDSRRTSTALLIIGTSSHNISLPIAEKAVKQPHTDVYQCRRRETNTPLFGALCEPKNVYHAWSKLWTRIVDMQVITELKRLCAQCKRCVTSS